MVIELGGVQFGLKSNVWFQNQISAQYEIDLKSSMIQTKIDNHFEITQIQEF